MGGMASFQTISKSISVTKYQKKVDELGLLDVAVGRRSIGSSSSSSTSQFSNENTVIQANSDLKHWAIKFKSCFYELYHKKGKIFIVKLQATRQTDYTWQVMGQIVKRQSEVIALIQDILIKVQEKNISYNFVSRNCQHFAAAIGNFAMGLKTKEQALQYFTK